MFLQDNPLCPAKLIEHVRTAAPSFLTKAAVRERATVVLDDLRWNDRPGRIGHLAKRWNERTAHFEGKCIRVWRLERGPQRICIRRSRAGDSKREPLVGGSNRSASPDPALFHI